MADLDITLVDSSYELVCKLASSGQADVYQARGRAEATEDPDFDFIFKVYKSSPKANQAMKNERAVLQRLEDRQVKGVPIPIGLQAYGLKSGSEPTGSGLLTKFLKGQDLARLLESKGAHSGFDPGQVADWTKKLCEILGKVHQHGIVHGDLKPGNILWNKEHKVIWLIDFGSAVFAGRTAQRSLTLTRPYASPQLLAGETSKVTDDVFALGVTLYELLAGKQQYPVALDWNLASGVLALQLKSGLEKLEVADAFNKRELFEDGDADLLPRFAAVVQKCLHPDPKARFQTLDKVADGLKLPNITVTVGISREESVVVPPSPMQSGNRYRVALAAGVVVLVGLVAAGAVAISHLKSPLGQKTVQLPPTPPGPIPPPPGLLFTNLLRSRPPVENPQVAAAPPASGPQADSKPSGSSTTPAPVAKFDGTAGRFTNSLGMVFVPVQTQSGKVWFCVWQTRVADFRKFQQQAGIEINPTLKARLDETNDIPVREVNWEQAQAFCSWLTKQDRSAGVLPLEGSRYRLPRDLEWSSAAGLAPEAGQTPRERSQGKVDLHSVHPVRVPDGRTNVQGLCDLGDDVAEWGEENYGTDAQTKFFRISRPNEAEDPETRYRGMLPFHRAEDWLGFRCVLEPEPASDSMVAGGGPSPEQKMSKKN